MSIPVNSTAADTDLDSGEKSLVLAAAASAKKASRVLGQSEAKTRDLAIENFCKSLNTHSEKILAANERDYAAADKKDPLTNRLKLDRAKLASLISGLQALLKKEDPLGKIDLATELDEDLNLYRVTCPIGVVAVIFEARPDALPQIAALCLKSGNAIILKGGKEAVETNNVLFDCLREALRQAGLPKECAYLFSTRTAVKALLQADKYIDLVVPRGSNSLVTFVKGNTHIPVLGHAEGICHIYIDNSADAAKAKRVVVDAKVNYPAACNALETLLIHKDLAPGIVIDIVADLRAKGVEVKADKTISTICGERSIAVLPAEENDWSTEYGDLTLSIKSVDNIDQAIDHINNYGSGHTDGIICENEEVWQHFFRGINSAGVFRNASTRFADGFRYGFGAEVGISTNKMHPRGPVGIEGLVTYKYKLEGTGQTVEDYSNGQKSFTHINISPNL